MSHPRVIVFEECMREGMQIESADIAVERKVQLLEALSHTGLRAINVGSFVSQRYTPQMGCIDDVLGAFRPLDGIHYYYLALNPRGHERARAFPWLRPQFSTPYLRAELCGTFLRRNNNRSKTDIPARWDALVAQARADGATEAAIDLGSAFGSNFEGPFALEERMDWVNQAHARWVEAGIPVVRFGLFDPMSWCMPHWVEETVVTLRDTYPTVKAFHLHLHDARGMALPSIYAALRELDDSYTVSMDVAAGGIGGCPYCGNGRATGMAPTEDLVNMLHAMGVRTGVDLDRLVDAVWLLEDVLGRPTPGHVSKAGWLPGPDERYDANLPLVETMEQARHFKLGDKVTDGSVRPWKEPIPEPSPHR